MAEKTPEYLRKEYTARINKALDFIDSNIDKELSLEKIASVAHFSRFHFHRIFSSFMGETLNQFIQRIRIEKAGSYLLTYPNKSITEVAFDCGFTSSASFARSFKEAYGLSATEWRNKKYADGNISKMESKIGKEHSKRKQVIGISSSYIGFANNNQTWRLEMKDANEKKIKANVKVEELPETTVAYIRHVGSYAGNGKLFEELFTKLFKWAGPRGLVNFPETQIINVYHDDPNITEQEKLRLSCCITVPAETVVDGEIGKMNIKGGKYAIAHFEIDVDQYTAAWTSVFAGWLPESGFEPADGVCFERCLNNPDEHPEKKHIVDICVPVKPVGA